MKKMKVETPVHFGSFRRPSRPSSNDPSRRQGKRRPESTLTRALNFSILTKTASESLVRRVPFHSST
jgi:hypothetical protein